MLLNLKENQWQDIEKNYLYVKDLFKSKYQLLINRGEEVGIKNLKNSEAFINYSQTIDDVYENFKDYNPTKKKSINSVWWYDSRYGK